MHDDFAKVKRRFLRNGPRLRLASKTSLDLAQILAHVPYPAFSRNPARMLIWPPRRDEKCEDGRACEINSNGTIP
jgi:hypothetical protein